tara:strand:+ start:4890 stop:5588 length:699 start_codon:yes stop_codon:yes gene_type:complete
MTFNINIQNFEGPLDLLLFFVQRDKMDIYDIQISKITNDFLKYIEEMDEMNLDIGAEFIFMASILMKIKSKMLLPVNENEKDEELIDLKRDLSNKLIEYKKYKQISSILIDIHDDYNRTHKVSIKKNFNNYKSIYNKVDMNDFISIFSKLINQIEFEDYNINLDTVTVNDQIKYIKSYLDYKSKVSLDMIIKNYKDKIYIICTFIAILDLLKNNYIKILQKENFSKIYILKV